MILKSIFRFSKKTNIIIIIMTALITSLIICFYFTTGLKDADAYHERGFTFRMKVQYKKAIKDFDEAIKLNPTYVLTYNNRGCTKTDLRQHKEDLLKAKNSRRTEKHKAFKTC